MALPGPPEPPRGAPRKVPSLLEVGALCLDSEIILGFTSHLLRRRTKVAEGGPAREPLQLLEVSPSKRLTAGPEQDPCGSRPAPEGAGPGAEQGHSAGGGGWCRHCHTKLAELKRQAWKLVSGPGTPLRDPCLSALLLDKLPACRPEAERRCDVCATHLTQLTREALQLLQAPASREDPGTPHGGPSLMPPGPSTTPNTTPSLRDGTAPAGPAGRQSGRLGPDRRKGPAWPSGPSVQVSVAPAGLGGALSTVTIQAQQCLEGMWSVSRVNSFLPPACLAEAAVAAVAVADTVRDGPPPVRSDGSSKTWGLVTPASGGSAGPSAAASFFLRAAQKLSLASKRKKPPPPPPPAPRQASTYPTDFSGVLQLWPPPAPPCLLRATSKAKDNPSSVGKVKVMLRIWPAQGAQRSAESTSFLKVDPRKKQVTLYDPAAGPPGSTGPRRAPTAAVPKMFAFDAVFPQDSEQAEVCSGTVAEVLQSVVGGADGCIFSFGHASLGKSYTMIGRDSSPQSLGVVPCAISWLFRLMDERRERTGARFSVRVSAVEVCGRGQSLRDLLAGVASGSLQDTQSPGVYLREDLACGAQLQNQNELRAPTAEKAAFYLDAALAAREAAGGGAHVLFTLHLYQYRVEKCGRGGMSGGRSRLHLIDLGSCEEAPGGPPSLSLSALGSVILALVSGAKHVPYREHRLTALLQETLATANCRTTMIAHVSDAPARHAETLSTVQLAARVHRLRRKKVKYASSSSGGDSSCEEGRARRPPHLRPFHPRAVAPDPDRLAASSPGDPDYSSSSEQSCDTVIYVGPGGTALSDRELTDSEGPPDFVPIIPALSRARPAPGPREADHFRCSTFAELQERLGCIPGTEGPPGAQAVLARAGRKPSPPEAAASRTPVGAPLAASTPHGSPSPDTQRGVLEPPKASADQREEGSTRPELPMLPDKATAGGGGRLLPNPAPPPPWRPEAGRASEEPGGGDSVSVLRTPPVGRSGQAERPCPPARGRRLEQGLLTTTVTLQQPVELNGEDELVFTLVEELSLGGLAGPGRPSSLASFGSDCSLQALASGSRPVSIISSINDEFDAYTSAPPGGSLAGAAWAGGSQSSSCTSAPPGGSLAGAAWAGGSQSSSCTSAPPGGSLDGAAWAGGSQSSSCTSAPPGGSLDGAAWAGGSQSSSCTSAPPGGSLAGAAWAGGSQSSSCTSAPPAGPWTGRPGRAAARARPAPQRPRRVPGRGGLGGRQPELFLHLTAPRRVPGRGGLRGRQPELVLHLTAPGGSLAGAAWAGGSQSSSYTSAPPGGSLAGAAWAGGSQSSSGSSWLSAVSVCTADGLGPTPAGPPDPVGSEVLAGPPSLGSSVLDGGSPEDSGLQRSERGRLDSPGPARGPRPAEEVVAAPSRYGREPSAVSPRGLAPPQTLHSSLPRTPRTTSATGRVGCPHLAAGPPGPGGLFEDPWLLRADDCGPPPLASAGRAPSPALTLACARRVVDGCEVGQAAHRPEVVAPIPPLRRGATTLGVSTPSASFGDAQAEAAACLGSPKATPASKKSAAPKGGFCARPGGVAPPAPPVRKSSLEHKNGPGPSSPQAGSPAWPGAAAFLRGDGEARPGGRADHSIPRATSSLKSRPGKAEAACRPATHGSLERCEGLAHGNSKAREAPGRLARTVPRLGVPPTSPMPGSAPACRSSPAKGAGAPKAPSSGSKGRSLAAGGPRALGSSAKPLAPTAGRAPCGPMMGPRPAPRAAPGVGAKASRGTIMGTKQALRATHSRVHELAAGGAHSRGGPSWGSADSDSGNDSGVNVSEERLPAGPALPSPYSKVTAPRRPQRYSSGHGSDNSSVLSGELPPAMGRTALFYHSGGSSGYESVLRDSEATGSASSAPDSMSDSGAASPGARSRTLKSPKKRATGLQRRRLIPAPLPDAAALGRKPNLPGQWVDLPPPLAGTLKEPFEIKVYEIDDVERLQRRRLPPGEGSAEPSHSLEKGPVCVSARLRLAERRLQRLQEVQAKRELLRGELAETQGRLMLEPGRWLEQFEVDPGLEPESAEYLVALERATAALEQCVNLCKAHVMMVTCFDISAAAPAAAPGPQEVDV